MPKTLTAPGFIRSHGNNLVGSFDVAGVSYHLLIDAKRLTEEFECSNATLNYNSLENLIEGGSWSGTIGKTDLRIGRGKGTTIIGPLNAPRLSSVRVSGAGRWMTGAAALPDLLDSANCQRNDRPAFVSDVPSIDVNEDPVKLEREKQLLESGVPIIAVFGQSGTGKSTFINLITSEQQKVGKGLQSCTSEISVLEAVVGGKRVVVIDTPGIDDTRVGMKEADILVAIARRLDAMGRRRIWVTGVLFMHRITDNKFSQTAGRVSSMLKSLCGSVAMRHVMLCTTMWDKVSQEEGDERFIELCETGAWKEMVDMGASTSQISGISSDAKAEAEDITSELIKNAEPVELAIQDEMINQGKTVAETGAGRILAEHLKEARAEVEREMEEMREYMRKESAAAEARLAQMMLAHKREVEELKKKAENEAREQHAHATRLQQERERAERDMKALREAVMKERDAKAEKAQQQIDDRGREVEEIRRQTKAMDVSQQAAPRYLRQERGRAGRKVNELHEKTFNENGANVTKAPEAMWEWERQAAEMKEEMEEQTRAQQAHAQRFQQEQEKAERRIQLILEKVAKENATCMEQLKRTVTAQQREIDELTRQKATLERVHRPFPWWDIISIVCAIFWQVV